MNYLRNPIATFLLKKYSVYYLEPQHHDIKTSHLDFVFPVVWYLFILIFAVLPLIGDGIFKYITESYFLLILNFCWLIFLIIIFIYKSNNNIKKLDTFLLGMPFYGRYISSKIDIIGYIRNVTTLNIERNNEAFTIQESVMHRYGNYGLLLKKKMVTGQIRVMLPKDQVKSQKWFVTELGDHIQDLLDDHPDHFFASGEIRSIRR